MSSGVLGSRIHAGVIAGLGLGVALSACKPQGTDAPRPDLDRWSLAEIEAQLERNDRALAEAGIMVAAATPATEPAPSDGGGDFGQQTAPAVVEAEDDDASEYPAPGPSEAPEAIAESSMEYEPADAPRREISRKDRRASNRAERRESSSRCERICDLADATCSLEAQICDLAARHPEQERYLLACERAELQCEAAMDACDGCDDD
ncbi:MAG: hypothetical protein AB1Z98_21660 [Nannocystaceae bacterium]